MATKLLAGGGGGHYATIFYLVGMWSMDTSNCFWNGGRKRVIIPPLCYYSGVFCQWMDWSLISCSVFFCSS